MAARVMLFLYGLLLKLISAMASSQHCAVCASASLPISLRLWLGFLGFHAKTTRTNVHFVDIVRRLYRNLANQSAPSA